MIYTPNTASAGFRTILRGNPLGSSPSYRPGTGIDFFSKDCKEQWTLPFDAMNRGLLLLGTTGSGKTTVLRKCLHTLFASLREDDRVLIFDPKLELAQEFYSKARGDLLIDPEVLPTAANPIPVWNVFDELEAAPESEKELCAREIAATLLSGSRSSSQPFFEMAARNILAAIILSVYKLGGKHLMNNAALLQLCKSPQSYRALLEKFPETKAVLQYLGDGINNKALGVIGTLQAAVESTLVGSFAAASPNSFSMTELARKKGVTFIRSSIRYGDNVAPVIGHLIDTYIKEALSNGRGRTFLVFEELSMLPSLKQLGAALNYGRGRGVHTICCAQSIAQLGDDDRSRDALLAGFSSMIALRCSDPATTCFASEKFGDALELYHYAGGTYQRQSKTVEAMDLQRLKPGEAFCSICSEDPFYWEFAR